MASSSSQLAPASTLEEILDLFDPDEKVDASSDFYIPRNEDGLKKLSRKLKRGSKKVFHGFLSGHVGSGKTTELMRLCNDQDIQNKYLPIFISIPSLQIDSVNLSHDALLVGIARTLLKETTEQQLNRHYQEELDNWGKSIVTTYIKDEGVKAEVGTKGSAWFAYFKASLQSRNQWKHEEKSKLEPKVNDLIALLNRMAQDIQNKTGKALLVMVDDLEKGNSEAEKQMHQRLFSEYFKALTEPNFTIIYTLPVYFKALPERRMTPDQMFSFCSARIYEPDQKQQVRPALNKDSVGYKLIHDFVSQRLDDSAKLFEEDVLDELILIGGGLFRDTDAAIYEAADNALDRDADTISMDDVEKVFNSTKKSYQPTIRGDAIAILQAVNDSDKGWQDGVEPFLQSRAIVEYENGDLWLDVRYVLKQYLESLVSEESKKILVSD